MHFLTDFLPVRDRAVYPAVTGMNYDTHLVAACFVVCKNKVKIKKKKKNLTALLLS